MTNLSTNEAIKRFGENEERVDKFANEMGTYQTRYGSFVKTIRQFMADMISRYFTYRIRDAWNAATSYEVQDIVTQSGIAYICIIAHTSTVFATDVAAGKWAVYQGATKNELASGIGATLIGWINSGVGAVLRLISDRFAELHVSVMDYIPTAEHAAIIAKTSTYDCTNDIKKCRDAHKRFWFPDGLFNVSDEIELNDNHNVKISAGTKIKQTATEKRIFFAVQKTNVWVDFEGGELFGKGTDYVNGGGNQNRYAKGIEFLGCTRSGSSFPKVKNFGSAGISVIGGDAKILFPVVEGTHTHGTPLPAEANYQNGIYVANDVIYGKPDVLVLCPDVSGVAQGTLRESIPGAPAGGRLQIVAPRYHDIPGQHAIYLQAGPTVVTNPVIEDVALAGFKVQLADANINDGEFVCTDMICRNIGSHMAEVAALGTGTLRNVKITGVGYNVGRCLVINGGTSGVERLEADLTAENILGEALYIFGAKVKDIDAKINGKNVGIDGALVTATNSSNINIRPTFRTINTSNYGSGSGVRVESLSAKVKLHSPDIEDGAGGHMKYGLFNSIVGSEVEVFDSARFVGASDYAVRATGKITEWPTKYEVSGTNGKFLGLNFITSSKPIQINDRSTSATNVVLWQQELDDESAIVVKFELIGKYSDGSKRRAVSATALFYRNDAGICVLEGTDIDADIATAGFTGSFGIQANGANTALLVVNSGASVNIDWTVKVTSTKA